MAETVTQSPSLAESLVRIAASPDQAGYLHSVLGDYCHQSRNILHSLKMRLYLTRNRAEPSPTWQDADDRYQSLERTFERLQSICQPINCHHVCLPFGLLVEDRRRGWESTLARGGVRLVLDSPNTNRPVRFDPSRLGQALDEIVAWRSVVATGGELRLAWYHDVDGTEVRWENAPGGGIEAATPPLPHCKSAAAEDATRGAMAVAYLGRLMSLAGGDLTTVGSPWSLVLRWPNTPEGGAGPAAA